MQPGSGFERARRRQQPINVQHPNHVSEDHLMKKIERFALCTTLTVLLAAAAVVGQELKPEEIIAKHLDSIGKRAAVDQVQTLFALGLSSFESQVPAARGGGKALIVSDRGNLMF